MADARIALLQTALRSSHHESAWSEFLETHAPTILQAVRYSIWDEDRANDCFVYVCEQLKAKQYRRLLQYRVDGGSSFATWLRVVSRNLALDWHRKESGRLRIFASIARLSPFHQEIYRLRQQKGFSLDETFFALRGQFPSATTETVAEADRLVGDSLTSRQHWLLTRQRSNLPVPLRSEEEEITVDVADAAPDPEAQAISQQEWHLLRKALLKLEPADRLLLQLRFGQGVTLAKIAQYCGLQNAQTADRKLRVLLQQLRENIS